MRYYRSRFQSALALLQEYSYPEPFHIASKNFFKKQKKFGSKDRKAIADICYTYFRTGLSFSHLSLQEGLLLSGLFLDMTRVDDWNAWSKELGYSHQLDADFFDKGQSQSYITQKLGIPIRLYPEGLLMKDFAHYADSKNIRFRPKNWAKDHTDDVSRKLGVVGVRELAVNQQLEDTTQVQDLSSQYICSQMRIDDTQSVWDMCSGSGGKSLNLSGQYRASFYLSDVRPGILQNAKARFKSMFYDALFGTADLSKPISEIKFGNQTVKHNFFDVILADVPCTGSGTWFRIPENFTHFDYKKLGSYADRQKQLARNGLPFLKKGGKFYYITCSVFAAENEEVRAWIEENTSLQLVNEIAFDGIAQKADGMYMAEFELPD